MMRGKALVLSLALALAFAASIALLHPGLYGNYLSNHNPGFSPTTSTDGAYRADLRFLSQLGGGRDLVQLTGVLPEVSLQFF